MKLFSSSFVAVAAILGSLAGNAQANTFLLTYELPGVQNSTATFFSSGVESFDSRAIGLSQTFASNFSGSSLSGTYLGVEIAAASTVGGAGGTGNFATTFTTAGYQLQLNNQVNYFGFWLSALDAGNLVSFYEGSTLVGQFNAGSVLSTSVMSNPAYYGNPNAPYQGANGSQPYAFVNFFSVGAGDQFDRIVFSENPTIGGYETDNHTVGLFRTISGIVINPIPEPATILLLLTGLGAAFLISHRKSPPVQRRMAFA